MHDTAFYGQVQFYLVLDLPNNFPFKQSQLKSSGPQGRKLALALVAPVKLEGSSARRPAYSQLKAPEIVSITTIAGLVGRVWDDMKRRWMIVGRPEVMKLVDSATYGV